MRRGLTLRRIAHPAAAATVSVTLALTGALAAGAPARSQTAAATPVVFAPVADARVEADAPSRNFGSEPDLTADGSPLIESYLRFDVTGLAGPVVSARLRVFTIDVTTDGPAVYATDPGWSESGLTWSTRPLRAADPLADAGSIGLARWLEYDVTAAVPGNGAVSFALVGTSPDGLDFHSREGGTPPQLVVEAATDATPPTVTITAPAGGSRYSEPATVTIAADAADETAVARVDFYDNSALAGTDATAPYTHAWSFDRSANGSHSWTAVAVDEAGNPATSAAVAVTVEIPDATPSSLLFAPVADARVEAAQPSANFGASRVLIADAMPLMESYLRFDVAGLSGPVDAARLRVFTIDPTADGPAVYSTDPRWSESGLTWNTRPLRASSPLADAGSIGLGRWLEYDVTAAVAGNGAVSFALVATSTDGLDVQSREGASPPQLAVVTTAVGDTMPPTVAITAPAAGTRYTEPTTATIAADAADDTAVARVEFYDNGTLAATDTAAPYTHEWTVVRVANGAHAWTAVAVDGAGNTTTSAPVTLGVEIPDFAPPTVAITAPAAGSRYTEPTAVTIAAEAADDSGVARVEFYDNSTLAGTDITAPYAHAWSFGRDANGSHSWTAVAVDTAGNPTTSVAVMLTVDIPAVTGTVTLAPEADARVDSSQPATNFGRTGTLQVDAAPFVKESYLRFVIPGAAGTVTSARLRVFAYDATVDGPAVYAAATDWSETAVTWNARPARTSGLLDDLAVVAAGSWAEFDVTAAVRGSGPVSLALVPTSDDGLDAYSREGAKPPQLVLTVGEVPLAVSISSPAPGSVLRGPTETIAADVTGDVASVAFRLDGVLAGTDTTAPYSFEWSFDRTANGTHTWTATATDAGGREATSAPVEVTVAVPDASPHPPTVSITSPLEGTVYTEARTVTILAEATDDGGVARVELYDNGVLAASDADPPYTHAWTFGTAENGRHTWVARAYDTDGNAADSAPRAFWVSIGGITASAETDPMPHSGDASDDPAIWIHPTDPALSTIIGTDKLGGIGVYDLSGRQLHYHTGGAPNNVDLRNGFLLAGEAVSLVAASDRAGDFLRLYRVDPATRGLVTVAAREIATGIEPYGACMYRSAATGRFYAFLTDKNGTVQQWELSDVGGRVDASIVRTLELGSITEGCVADDATGRLYIAEENVGIWSYGAEPDAGAARTSVDVTGAGGHLTADVEGLAIFDAGGGAGFLLGSSQGSDSFTVYERGGANAYLTTFRILAGVVDAVSETDGIEVASIPLGPAFPDGLFVAQDGNEGLNGNFKLVPWGRIAAVIEAARLAGSQQRSGLLPMMR